MADGLTLRKRYLTLLKGALLDQHYLENEVRVDYLARLPPGTAPDLVALRNPARSMPFRYEPLARARVSGRSADASRAVAMFPYTEMGRPALDHLEMTVADLADRGVEGDMAECGVGRGGGSMFLRASQASYGRGGDRLWVIDPFLAADNEVASDPGETPAAGLERLRADLSQVMDGFGRFDLLDDRVRFIQGLIAQSIPDAPIGDLSLLRLGESLGSSLPMALELLLPRVVQGGCVVVEGVGSAAVDRSLIKARLELGAGEPVERVDWNTVSWTVSSPTVALAQDATAPKPAHRVWIPEPIRTEPIDLTVVVVFYNMKREALRTLQSLSRSYQQGIEDLTYEVLVIDNGSSPDQQLSEEFVSGFGPEFRLLDLGPDPSPSPTTALNAGIAAGRGDAVALMIDGAHVLTPGVLRFGMLALTSYGPAVVAAQQWYVGPGQQGDAQQAGYDQKVEDRLFRQIKWPTDGYRLFEISHFIGDRDWFDGIVESNCLFVPRSLLEQVGGYDDSFDMPGGGYANLELFERLNLHPGVTATSILGEGTFHQFHGGTTTNVADEAARRERVSSYGGHFADLRGRPLLGLNTPVHYVGTLATKSARRTRSRRDVEFMLRPDRDPVNDTVAEPAPVPDEFKQAAIEAVWNHQAWRGATWLGRPVQRFPTDIHSYQELVVATRPEVVILLGDDPGLPGRALFMAALCDQLGGGRVIAIGSSQVDDDTVHPRITQLSGEAESSAMAAKAAGLTGSGGAMVFIGLGAPDRILGAFENYAPLVAVGGYVVIENTILNGRPVASSFGTGPREGLVEILNRHPEFVPDPAYEQYTITFNRSGFLRRTADR